MNKIITFCIFISVLCSCSTKKDSSKKEREVVKFDLKLKESARELEMELLPCTENFLSATNFYVYQDSVLIVCNEATDIIPFFEFYNLKTKEKINQFILKGKAENEMLSANSTLNGNKLIVNDSHSNNYVSINIDSVLQKPNYKLGKQISYGLQSMHNMNLFEDGRALFLNPFHFDNDNFADNKKEPCFVVFDPNKKDTLSFGEHDYFTCNVTQGDILINEKRDRVVFCSSASDQIEIFDGKLNPIKKTYGFSNIKLEYKVSDRYIFVKTDLPLFFLGGCYDDEFMYVSYFGGSFFDIEKSESWLFKMDWDGNVIETFKLPQVIGSLSNSGEKGVLYCTGSNEDEVSVLYKININK